MSTSTCVLEHMHKKFEINRTKINDGCQSGRKVVPHDTKSDLPLAQLTHSLVDSSVCIYSNLTTFVVNCIADNRDKLM